MSYEDLPDTVKLPDGRVLVKSPFRSRYACKHVVGYMLDSEVTEETDHLEGAKHWIMWAFKSNPLGEEYDSRLQYVMNAVKELVSHLEIRS